MSRLVESIKIENGNMLNVSFHNERMVRSLYGIYGVTKEPDIEKLIVVPEFAKTGVYKCRLIYDDKSSHVEFIQYCLKPVRSLRLIIDDNICYPYKYVARDNINRLMDMRGDCDDILIVKNGMVTDSSYANVVFSDSAGKWVTPATFLLPGTRRASLLSQGLITEVSISSSDIKKYTKVKLINAMLGLDDTQPIAINNII